MPTSLPRIRRPAIGCALLLEDCLRGPHAGHGHIGGRYCMCRGASRKAGSEHHRLPPGGTIPTQFTCSGENISPALAWSQPPADTQSFVLIVDDPDYPPARSAPARGAASSDQVPAGASGSSTISTKLCVCAGGWLQARAGEIFSPLHVNCVGIVPPGRKAVVLTSSFPGGPPAHAIPAANMTMASVRAAQTILQKKRTPDRRPADSGGGWVRVGMHGVRPPLHMSVWNFRTGEW